MKTAVLSQGSEISRLIRAAADYAAAGGRFLAIYEERMREAGAALFMAFKLAAAEAGKGRLTLPDSFYRELYNKVRGKGGASAWWSARLKEGGMSREVARRLMQWYMDPGNAEIERQKYNKYNREHAQQNALRIVTQSGKGRPKNEDVVVLRTLRTEMLRVSGALRNVAPTNRSAAIELVRGLATELEKLQ